MDVKVLRPSGRKDWYIQVCEAGKRYLRHVGSREAAFEAKKAIAAQSLKAGRPMDCSKVRRAHEMGLKAAGLRHTRVHDLRGTYASLGVSAGTPVYHVSKSLGHSETSTTERLYANLAPGAARELPNILERFVRDVTVQNANQVRTE